MSLTNYWNIYVYRGVEKKSGCMNQNAIIVLLLQRI